MWIEINYQWDKDKFGKSVTSYTEVWIEIKSLNIKNLSLPVTSYTEVWIEITRI